MRNGRSQRGNVRATAATLEQSAAVPTLDEALENTHAVLAVVDALAGTTSVADAARAALNAVRTAFGWAYGSYWTLDARDGCLGFCVESGSVSDDFRRATSQLRVREGEGLSGRAWQRRDVYFVQDLGEMRDCGRAPIARQAGVKSGVCFPIVAHGDVVGTMDFFALETLTLSEERLGVLRGVGALVSSTIERLAASEEQAAAECRARELQQRERAAAETLQQKADAILSLVNGAEAGDLTQEADLADDGDACSEIGQGMNRFLASLRQNVAAMAQSAHALASSSEQLSAVSQQMGSNAEETSAQATVVSAAAEQVSKNVQTVASAAEEMTASIKEIAKNAVEAARVATQAVHVAGTTNTTVAKLGESSAEIGKVIKVITSIAQQTNLLALNATIEAARAGEAGKGFAVVANEVKELAKETAKATEDIGQKIEAIQSDTQSAVQAIEQIGAIINQINDIQNTIASAVEEQTATTNEIGRNVTEAAKGSAEIAHNITGVAEAAQSTTSGAADTQRAAGELARMAAELQRLVGQYRF